jgi:two-component system, sensor histidine kinase LadS
VTRHSLGAALLAIACCVWGSAMSVHAAAQAPVPVELAATAAIPLSGQPQALVARGSVTVAAVAQGALDPRFAATAGTDTAALSADNELWVSLRLRNATERQRTWQLQFTLPSIDEITLFERRGDRWSESSAGDQVALKDWPRVGRFPKFEVKFQPGEAREMFVRVRNASAVPLALRLVDADEATAAEERLALVFGVVLGALALLVAACLLQAALYRDSAYFLFGAYALLLGASFAALSGLAGRHWWGDSPAWADLAKTVFPVAAAGVSVWLVRALCNMPMRGQLVSRVSATLGAFVVASGVVEAALGTPVLWLAAVAMTIAAASVIAMAIATSRRGDPMGAWTLAAHLPLIASTILIVMRMYGVAPLAFDSNILVSISIALIVPLLLVALHLRSKEILTLRTRSRELVSTDPLTGLLSPALFRERVAAAILRYRKSRHNAVVLYVRVANHARIRDVHGGTLADQSMVRAAMTLQRLFPDADSMGRVGESAMGLILETVTARAAISERAARVVAHGLMPLPDVKPEVILNFQVAANSLADNLVDAQALHLALETALAAMSLRTRRPIRFLDAGPAQLAGADAVPSALPLQ